MAIIGTFNGLNIVSLPCDTLPGVTAPSSIEWDAQEVVSSNVSPFTGQMQTYDWMSSFWQGTISLPPMTRYAADAWAAFILQCRGQSNAFQFGDPKAVLPKGSAMGVPLVNGANQTGYSLSTRGWNVSVTSLLLPGDYLQIGYRLYRVLSPVNSDASGNATIPLWPNIRDLPADGTAIITRACKGLFRLAQNTNKYSTNAGNYGINAIQIREAI